MRKACTLLAQQEKKTCLTANICLSHSGAPQLQQFGEHTFISKATKIAVAVALPVLSALLTKAVLWYLRWWEARDERFLKKLVESKRKMIKDLKV